jgi:hypothetical protein
MLLSGIQEPGTPWIPLKAHGNDEKKKMWQSRILEQKFSFLDADQVIIWFIKAPLLVEDAERFYR